MPLYEYYCEPCNGIFETIRPMREASLPVPCVQCNRDAPRIMSAFNAFTFRDGYPRRIPDKGTYWHMGKEVKQRATRMVGWEHPELAKPEPKARPLRGDAQTEREKQLTKRRELGYRGRWGVDEHGFRTVKAKKVKPERKTIVK
jgi:putative FmdB family regulatory protein